MDKAATLLARQVALITGAAGAIGSGIAEGLLEQGCHVAVTDLAERLLLILFKDFLGIGFHLYALYCIYKGMKANEQFEALERGILP